GTADRNRSHWSTSKTPSYTKSVSWQHHQKWGVSWEAVGAYNAGFRKTERQNQRRLAYASDVYRIYTGIKSSKGIRIPATKKSLPEINSVQNN
ncbi:hypothetical protein SNB87_03365, partial [Escherichia coli]|nr:hypothetical protein [Escherichia coli]MEA0580843.1 hypothetical protein [Escherichia coli]